MVVDVANEDPVGPPNGNVSPRENGSEKQIKKEHSSHSPHSSISSNSSTPSSKHKEVCIRMHFSFQTITTTTQAKIILVS